MNSDICKDDEEGTAGGEVWNYTDASINTINADTVVATWVYEDGNLLASSNAFSIKFNFPMPEAAGTGFPTAEEVIMYSDQIKIGMLVYRPGSIKPSGNSQPEYGELWYYPSLPIKATLDSVSTILNPSYAQLPFVITNVQKINCEIGRPILDGTVGSATDPIKSVVNNFNLEVTFKPQLARVRSLEFGMTAAQSFMVNKRRSLNTAVSGTAVYVTPHSRLPSTAVKYYVKKLEVANFTAGTASSKALRVSRCINGNIINASGGTAGFGTSSDSDAPYPLEVTPSDGNTNFVVTPIPEVNCNP